MVIALRRQMSWLTFGNEGMIGWSWIFDLCSSVEQAFHCKDTTQLGLLSMRTIPIKWINTCLRRWMLGFKFTKIEIGT